jgi:hypothetical protein
MSDIVTTSKTRLPAAPAPQAHGRGGAADQPVGPERRACSGDRLAGVERPLEEGLTLDDRRGGPGDEEREQHVGGLKEGDAHEHALTDGTEGKRVLAEPDVGEQETRAEHQQGDHGPGHQVRPGGSCLVDHREPQENADGNEERAQSPSPLGRGGRRVRPRHAETGALPHRLPD